MTIDPVCGMQVDETTALRAKRDERTFYFCSERCRRRFVADQVLRERSGRRDIRRNILRALRSFLSSELGAKAVSLTSLLVGFVLALNGLSVLNSYVGRDFISAIANKNMEAFLRQCGFYLVVFAVSSAVAVLYRFAEERLALLWRDWLTRRLLGRYLDHRVYHRLAAANEVENPDQRIAEDIRTFTTTTVSFMLMTLNATFTVLAFSGVLWSISPLLFGVAVVYAMAGSYVTFLVGRRLVGLNYAQSDREADFRSELIQVRENAESVALLTWEGRLKERLLSRLAGLVANARRVVAINRNVGFFTNIYNALVPIIPVFLVAHLFIRGKIEFGVVTQSAMAFAQLMGAFSLIVTQFQSISSYAAVIARLRRLTDAMDAAAAAPPSRITVCEADGRLAYENLTLRSAGQETLVSRLNLTLRRGRRTMILAASVHAKAALFKATAGLWHEGEGRIIRPGADHLLFLTEQPFLPKGTLRELLVPPARRDSVGNESILEALRALRVDTIVTKAGGLDMEQDWHEVLSLDEQMLVTVARVLLAAPHFVFLDRLDDFLEPPEVARVLDALATHGITCIAFGRSGDNLALFDEALHIAADGTWECRVPARAC